MSKHINTTDRRRAHVVIPEELLREVDALVGSRRRSDFFVEAAREKVARIKLRTAAHELAGFLQDAETPQWDTPENTDKWIRSIRRENDRSAFRVDARE